jgi:hypothetical protein
MVHRVRTIWKRRQQGSAALITTIAVSAILVVLFVGITTIATREIKQSINADNSNRALYAAEAGVEDAVRLLADDPSVREEECNELNTGAEVKVGEGSGADSAWTCRTITTVAADLTGRLEADESLNLNLARGRSGPEESAGYLQARYMRIEWNNPRDPAESASPIINRVSSWLPIYDPNDATNGLSWTGAAALEITSAWFGTDGGATATIANASINKGGLTGVVPVRTVIASPACTPNNCTYADFSPWNNTNYPSSTYINQAGVAQGTLVSNIVSKCDDNAAEYSCAIPNTTNVYNLEDLVKTEINDGVVNQYYDGSTTFANTTMLLRVRPRYKAASYRIRFYADSAGTVPVYMPDGYATIDVTARSSNYFRRVQAKKQLVPSVYDGVFDNALFSGGDICKNMKIYRDYRGAPDYTWNGSAKEQNDDAGKNDCGGDPDV